MEPRRNSQAKLQNDEEDDPSKRQVPQTTQVGNSPKYAVSKQLGKGGFGQVFLGTKIYQRKGATGSSNTVAIKFEHKNSKGCSSGPPYEWQVYSQLSNTYGVPKLLYKGEQEDWYVMIMDLLGPSLWDVWNANNQKLPESYGACIAIEAIAILEALHKKGYVHGDMKPENLLLGRPDSSESKRLYLVDLGLAWRWKCRSGHAKYEQKPDDFRGTIRYASTHSHLGRTASRRDDLESLLYTLIFLLKGRLPWQGFQGDNKAYLVCRKKMSTNAETLCRYLHPAFRTFADSVFNIKFDEEPKYSAYVSLFQGLLNPPSTRQLQLSEQIQLGVKRARECNDPCLQLETVKKVRIGCPAQQWITIFNAHQPMKQRYHFNVGAARLDFHIQKGFDDNLKISAVTCSMDLWALVMDAGKGYTHQQFKHSQEFLPKEWIMARWEEGYYITAIAGNSQGNSLVIMSKGAKYTQQSYKVSGVFPFEWIKKKWRDEFFITSLATAGSQWAVVMSRNVGYIDQVVELDFQYPSEGIHKRWDAGYRITACVSTNEQSAFVLSMPKRRTGREEAQETLRTCEFPSDHVREKWNRDRYMACIAYGRTTS